MNNILKTPLLYYVLFLLSFSYSILFNIIFLNYLGFLFLLIGFLISFFKEPHEQEGVIEDSVKLRIKAIQNRYLRNMLLNIYFFIKYNFIEGSYLCRFYMKSGRNVAFFVNTKELALGYKDWYLSDGDDLSSKSIQLSITETNVLRVSKDDIAELEYIYVTNFKKNVINPLLSFLIQPTLYKISLKGLSLMWLFLLVIISAYNYYLEPSFSLIGSGSFYTFKSIVTSSITLLYFITITCFLYSIFIGLLSSKKALNNYYLGLKTNGRILINQLITYVSIPILVMFVMKPFLLSILTILQNYGYFIK